MSEATASPTTTTPVVESPPLSLAPIAPDPSVDARRTLHRLANELMRTHNRKLLVEFLQIRRALR